MLNRVHSMSGRSGGSGNGPSMASSPSTTTRLEAKHDDWNLIYQAAGQFAKLKMNAGDGAFRNQCLPGAPRNISSVYPVNVPQSAIPDVHVSYLLNFFSIQSLHFFTNFLHSIVSWSKRGPTGIYYVEPATAFAESKEPGRVGVWPIYGKRKEEGTGIWMAFSAVFQVEHENSFFRRRRREAGVRWHRCLFAPEIRRL